jgi:acyl-ACP thioesterase
MKFFTNRCFRVVNTDGKVYGHGKSIWAMIDTETRQPCNLLDIKDGELLQWELKDEPNPMGKMTRVMMSHEAEQIKSIETGYHDVDINGHINSVKFIEHVMDLWETEWYCKHRLKRVDVAYVAEGHKGDKLELYREQTGEMEFCVRVCRAGADGTELCRMKLVFEN